MLPLKRRRSVAHNFNCNPVWRICVLLTHLFLTLGDNKILLLAALSIVVRPVDICLVRRFGRACRLSTAATWSLNDSVRIANKLLIRLSVSVHRCRTVFVQLSLKVLLCSDVAWWAQAKYARSGRATGSGSLWDRTTGRELSRALIFHRRLVGWWHHLSMFTHNSIRDSVETYVTNAGECEAASDGSVSHTSHHIIKVIVPNHTD